MAALAPPAITRQAASSQSTEPASILQVNFGTLAEATTEPLWLANRLYSEGILEYHIRNELETTDKPSYDKATRLWAAVMTAVKHHENPKQTLHTVCHVMKQRRELAELADSMISQLGHPEGSWHRGTDSGVVDRTSAEWGGGASSQTIDPTSVLQLCFASLAEMTTDPLWLADQLYSKGILDFHTKNELETTDKPSYDKASRLWTAVMTAVKHQGNSTQILLTVCDVMKQQQKLAQLADSMISQLGPQGPQHGNDDTVIQVTSDVTESMLRQKRVDDDTKTYTPDIPGDDPKIHSDRKKGLSPQQICFGIARIFQAVAMISNTIFVVCFLYGMDVNLFLLVTGGLLVQFMWFLIRKEFRNLIGGLFLTMAFFEVLPLLDIKRFIIVSQFPIYVEVINYCMKEAFQFVPMMFVFSFYMFVVALIALTVGRISLIEVIIVVVVVWAVLMIYKHSKITMALRSSILPYYHSNLPLPSEISHTNRPYFPIIVFLLVFEYFLWNRVHPSSPSQTVNRPDLLFGQFQLSFLFLLLGVLMFIGIWMISNHPVSEDHAFWKYVWRVVTIASIFIQLIELFILHSHNELPSFVDRAIIIIVILFVFSNKIVFIIAASLLIVLVFINTIFTYTFWRVPQNAPPVQATPLAMRGLFSQFSLIGTLVYVIAYEL